MSGEERDDLGALLSYLKATRGFDFTGYKRTTIERRVRRRMEEVGVADYADYVDHLEVHPGEFAALFNTILINVTAFFRDADAWDYMREDVVPRMLETKPDGAPIRVWSAGAASGEEAYTFAMLRSEEHTSELQSRQYL